MRGMSVGAAKGGSGASINGIDAIRADSPDALAALYREHGRALFRLAYRLTGTREDAEDVVHDVFVGLPEALGRYEERGSLAGWLKRVTARLALGTRPSNRPRRDVRMLEATAYATRESSRPYRVDQSGRTTCRSYSAGRVGRRDRRGPRGARGYSPNTLTITRFLRCPSHSP
jgi:hypothetical protein